ncbi:hypothetical protein ACFQVC_32790 [Streptomyces monticola]|uniref:Uncharacterized protein n=1 Tax=Streptomyces monticola TaxID=2666263 RepID=A0ABW2JUS5_9ACTN
MSLTVIDVSDPEAAFLRFRERIETGSEGVCGRGLSPVCVLGGELVLLLFADVVESVRVHAPTELLPPGLPTRLRDDGLHLP